MKRLQYIIPLIGCILLFSCKKKVEEQIVVLRPVKYTKVSSVHATNTNEFSGVTQAGKQSNLSFRVTGNLRSLKVKEGDRVKKRQSLASIDPTDYNVQLEQALANLKSAEVQYQGTESQVSLALSSYKRIESLYESNSVSLSDFENAKSNYENAQAQLEVSQAQIDAARAAKDASKNQVSYSYLNAPYAGIIQQINVEVNELVPAGNPVMVLSAEGDAEVSVGIPEIFIGQIKKGQKVKIKFSIADDEYDGLISEIGFNGRNSATYPVTVKILGTKKTIRPGMAAKVKFNFNIDDVDLKQRYPMIPAGAVGEDANGRFVFLLNSSDSKVTTVNKHYVKIGSLTNQGFEIIEGLKGDEKVATAGLKSLLDGMQVKLLEE